MSQLVTETFDYVSAIFATNLPSNCLYHNLTHTKRVFKSTKEIINESNLSSEEAEALQIAALLHDIGHIKGPKDHELVSAQMAADFLKEKNADASLIALVEQCILVTNFDKEPVTQIEKIIRDADCSHFAKEYFQESSELLRLELQLQGIADYGKLDWLAVNIDMLENKHSYYTAYGIENWLPEKEKNLEAVKNAKKKLVKEVKQEQKAQKELQKSEDPEKAVQSVFRITLKNHIKLSDIADTKSNILLSVNAIIISIALSNLIPKLDNPSNNYLIYPTVIFLIFTVTAIIMSVLATRPNVTNGKFTKEDVENKKVNLLFFGNFHKMTLTEFEWAMNEMLNDKEYIYSSMTKDLYFLGLVLQKKYKILRLTYTIFMVGIIVSVIAFALAFHYKGI